MPSKDLKVTLIGDDRTGTAFGSAGKNADGLGTKFANLGKGIALALGGAAVAGVAGLGAALGQGVRDAASYQKITDQVAQTIRSTGAAAGVSVGGLKEYAGQLESMSGVDEELILSGQNVLLTFTNIRNAAGAGNDIFDQASEAALNLSTTMGGDLVGANTLVGKALNDPIKGMTALRRAGVQLTEAQQDQIKAMVESGDTMGAQKILLGELETQFGGAAKAAGQGLTGSIARAKDAFQDLFRGIATALLPKLAELAEFFANRLMPGIKGIYDLVIGGDFTGALRDAFGWDEDSAAVDFLFSLRENFIAIWPHIKSFGTAIADVARVAIPALFSALQTVGSAIGAVVGFFREHDTAAKALGVVVGTVAGAITAAWVAQAAVSTVNAAKSVVAWFATATASTTSATIQSRSTAQIVVGWLAASVAAIGNAAKVVASWVLMGAQAMIQGARMAAAWVLAMGPVGWVIAAVVGLVALIVANWDTVVRWTKTAWNAVSGAVKTAWNATTGAIATAWNWIKGTLSAAWNWVRSTASAAWNGMVGIIRGAWNSATGAVRGAWANITSAISSGISSAVNFVRELPGSILGALGNLGSLLWNAGKSVIDGFLDGIKSAFQSVKNTLSDLTSLLPDWKGPAARDAMILHNAGQLVMGGFEAGLVSKFGDVQRTLGGFTDQMQGLAVRRPAGATLPGVRAQDSVATVAPGSGPTIHIENYNEARQSVNEVAEELTFLGRTRRG